LKCRRIRCCDCKTESCSGINPEAAFFRAAVQICLRSFDVFDLIDLGLQWGQNSMFKFTSALFGMACVFVATSAYAETANVTVSSGAKTRVGDFSVYNIDDCSSAGKPKMTFYQPDHGTFTAAWTRLKFEEGHKCRGKPINGMVIFYQSKGGYRGKDKGSYVASFPEFTTGSGFKAYTYNVNITVK
jgi:hypothetical protein